MFPAHPTCRRSGRTRRSAPTSSRRNLPARFTSGSTRRARPSTTRSSGWCADYPDQQDWLTTLFHSQQLVLFFYPYTSSAFDQLVRQADREQDQGKRDDLYQQASRLLSADAPAAWVRYPADRLLRKPWVRGLNINTLDFGGFLNPADVYVTKAKKH